MVKCIGKEGNKIKLSRKAILAVHLRRRGRDPGRFDLSALALAPHPFLPHLLGSYERELHPALEALCARAWDTIVNVGGGNGFFSFFAFSISRPAASLLLRFKGS